MRLVTFEIDGEQRLGSWIDEDQLIVDLTQAGQRQSNAAAFANMQSLIEAGPSAWDRAREMTEQRGGGTLLETDAVRLRAPLPRPAQIRDFLCFEEHLVNSLKAALDFLSAQADDPVARRAELVASGMWSVPQIWYKKPYYYTGNRFAISGPDDEIFWPGFSSLIDFELEFAAIVGTGGVNIRKEDALAHIFGFTIMNDWSARDEQGIVMEGKLGPGKAKDFDRGTTLGPCIVTLDEIGNPYDLQMTARVNGDVWCNNSSSTMGHRFEDVIAELSNGLTLHPGEVIGSGTVGGGCGIEQMRFLNVGDVVELEIERIGTLRNRICRSDGG